MAAFFENLSMTGSGRISWQRAANLRHRATPNLRFATLCGYTPTIAGLSNKPSGVFARGGDVTKQLSLGVSPKISFEAGIQRGLNYFQKKM